MDSVFESVGRPSRSLRPALSRGRSSCSPVTRLVRAWALSLGTGQQSESSRAHGRGARPPSRTPSSCTLQLTLIPQRQVEPAAHLGPVDSSSRPWDSAGKTSPGPDRDHRSRRVGLHVPAYILSPKGFGGIAPSCSLPPFHPPFGAHTGFSFLHLLVLCNPCTRSKSRASSHSALPGFCCSLSLRSNFSALPHTLFVAPLTPPFISTLICSGSSPASGLLGPALRAGSLRSAASRSRGRGTSLLRRKLCFRLPSWPAASAPLVGHGPRFRRAGSVVTFGLGWALIICHVPPLSRLGFSLRFANGERPLAK